MDGHYHDVAGVSTLIHGVHVARCPVCTPPAPVETAAEVPVVPIRRPHRKVVRPDEAA